MRVNTRTAASGVLPFRLSDRSAPSQGVNQNPHALPPVGALERPLSTNPGFRGVSTNAPFLGRPITRAENRPGLQWVGSATSLH